MPEVRAHHGNAEIYTCIQISPLWFASLRSEEVVIRKSAQGNFLFMVVMETLKYTCVSLPCIAWFASLRSEEVVMGKSA